MWFKLKFRLGRETALFADQVTPTIDSEGELKLQYSVYPADGAKAAHVIVLPSGAAREGK